MESPPCVRVEVQYLARNSDRPIWTCLLELDLSNNFRFTYKCSSSLSNYIIKWCMQRLQISHTRTLVLKSPLERMKNIHSTKLSVTAKIPIAKIFFRLDSLSGAWGPRRLYSVLKGFVSCDLDMNVSLQHTAWSCWSCRVQGEIQTHFADTTIRHSKLASAIYYYLAHDMYDWDVVKMELGNIYVLGIISIWFVKQSWVVAAACCHSTRRG